MFRRRAQSLLLGSDYNLFRYERDALGLTIFLPHIFLSEDASGSVGATVDSGAVQKSSGQVLGDKKMCGKKIGSSEGPRREIRGSPVSRRLPDRFGRIEFTIQLRTVLSSLVALHPGC